MSFRLGVPVKVLGAPLRAHDSRRWQNAPHLSVSLAYLADILTYLHGKGIQFYRLANQLAPYVTHPNLPHFHQQIEECTTELAAAGDLARQYGMRLTMHPAPFVQLNSPDEALAARAGAELNMAATIMERMGLGMDGVLVVHVGGLHDDPVAGRARFVRRLEQLPRAVRRRVVLENDDRRYSFEDALWIHRRTGVPLVLDVLHLHCLNPARRSLGEALAVALATWPPDQRPKIHISSPRTTLRRVHRNGTDYLQMPLPNQHSDFIDPFAFIDLLAEAKARRLRPFDIMLEARAKELALLRLREQVAHFAPELAGLVA